MSTSTALQKRLANRAQMECDNLANESTTSKLFWSTIGLRKYICTTFYFINSDDNLDVIEDVTIFSN